MQRLNLPSKGSFTVLFDFLLGAFLVGLLLVICIPPKSEARSTNEVTENASTRGILPLQGTTLVATIDDSISGVEPIFIGQRHFRTGIPGDKTCIPFSVIGARQYDEVFFLNTSSVPQRVFISFTSSCDNNTYMAAYNSRFNPNNLCENFIASAGVSGSTTWEFTVCSGGQFSLIVYALEPGLLCSRYSYSVFGNGIVLLGSSNSPSQNSPPRMNATTNIGSPAASDVTYKRRKRPDPNIDSHYRTIFPDEIAHPSEPFLPDLGTPLIALINDAIDGTEQSYIGLAHFRTGRLGDPSCFTAQPFGKRFYDEFFFFNNSPTTQKISVGMTSTCANNLYMAAYSPSFNPNDLCANFLAGAGASGNVNWDFSVCPFSGFSIIVYGYTPFSSCSAYSLTVFGQSITYLGAPADVSVVKTAPAGPIAVGANLVYSITVNNAGPQPARNITLRDLLPAGLTFVSLDATGLSCSTPPVGGTGAVVCTTDLFPIPGTGMLSSASLFLTVNVTPQAFSRLTNTVTVTHPGLDPNEANNSASAVTTVTGAANACLQSEQGDIIRFNTITGEYEYLSCSKRTRLTGRAIVSIAGCKITLQDTGPDPKNADRNISISFNVCAHSGIATIQAAGINARIEDSDTTNNSCECR